MTEAQTKEQALNQVRNLIAQYNLSQQDLFDEGKYVHYQNAEGKHWIGHEIPLWLLNHIKSGKALEQLIVKEDPFMEVQAYFEDKDPVEKASR